MLCNHNNKEDSTETAQTRNKTKIWQKQEDLTAYLSTVCEVRCYGSSLLVYMTPDGGAEASCWLTPHLQHAASTAPRWPQGERYSSSHWFISGRHKEACTQSHMHTRITHTVVRARTHARVLIKCTCKVNNLTGVKPSLPPSPLPSSFFLFFISAFLHHQNSSAPEY